MGMGMGEEVSDGLRARSKGLGQRRIPVASVQVKIGLILFASVLFAAAVLTFRGTEAAIEARTEGAERALAHEAESDATLVERALAGASADLRALRETPAIQGYLRANRTELRIDPRDDSSTARLWQERLATIMAGYLKVRPAYKQIVYVADDGQAIADTRQDDRISKVSVTALGGHESWSQTSRALTIGADEVLTTSILPVDDGAMAVEFAIPVEEVATGRVASILAVTVSTEDLFNELSLAAAESSSSSILVDGDGQVLTRSDPLGTEPAVDQSLEDELGSELATEILTGGSGVVRGNDLVVGYRRAYLVPGQHSSAVVALRILPQDTVVASANSFRNSSLLIMALVLALTVTVGTLLTRKMVSLPLRQITAWAERIADGDLTLDTVSKARADEVGQLSSAFSAMVLSLRSMVEQLKQSSLHLASAAEELTTVSGSMGESATRTASRAQMASTSGDQVSGNVADVVGAIEDMKGSIQEVAANAADASRAASQAVQVSDQTSRTIAKLGESSAKIGNVVQVIDSIAAQTNLLAINATIEAAGPANRARGSPSWPVRSRISPPRRVGPPRTSPPLFEPSKATPPVRSRPISRSGRPSNRSTRSPWPSPGPSMPRPPPRSPLAPVWPSSKADPGRSPRPSMMSPRSPRRPGNRPMKPRVRPTP